MSYSDQITNLHNAVLHGDAAMLQQIANTKPELDAATRLAVYADGVRVRLAEMTQKDYPATEQLLGEKRMQGALAAYAEEVIPTHWDANRYSIGFAHFLDEHLQEQDIIALAKLESAIVYCFWAEASEPLAPDALAVEEEQLAQLQFSLCTASQLLDLSVDAERYLTAFRAGNAPDAMVDSPCHLLVLRHDIQVKRYVLEPAEYALLKTLAEGAPFGAALEQQTDQATLAERLPAYLNRWLSEGFFQQV